MLRWRKGKPEVKTENLHELVASHVEGVEAREHGHWRELDYPIRIDRQAWITAFQKYLGQMRNTRSVPRAHFKDTLENSVSWIESLTCNSERMLVKS